MNDTNEERNETLKLAKAMATWFVRANNFYYSVDNPTARHSGSDVKQMSLQRLRTHFPEVELTDSIVTNVFARAIEAKTTDPTTSIPVWDGKMICVPGNPNQLIQGDGIVSINTWKEPEYRKLGVVERDPTLLARLLNAMIPVREDRLVLLDWLSWNLQNEADKPGWAVILYSRKKGTGKSTLCNLISTLFGEANSISQNNIEKLASRFNQPMLLKKFVVAEEIQLRADSSQGNALKTYITEKEAASERKGKDIEKVKQACCIMGTTNHFPSWIEEGERRFWVIDCDHDGHASGEKAQQFSSLVKELNLALKDPAEVAKIYNTLMRRKQREMFNPHSLDLSAPKTPLMERLQGASREVLLQLLEEKLNARAQPAIALEDLKEVFATELRTSVNRIRHMLPELGWKSMNVKWGGVDHGRTVWVHPDYQLHNGELLGPDGYREKFHGGDESWAINPTPKSGNLLTMEDLY